ncbi:MAG: ATP-binding protein [Thermoproteota archaeon]
MLNQGDLEKIGIVASDSSETRAKLLLQEDKERVVRAEEIVVIETPTGYVLGVLRSGSGINEALKTNAYRPSVAYAKRGGAPSGAREIYTFEIMVIGVITENSVEQNRMIIPPRSNVYMFKERASNPLEYVAGNRNVVWKAFLDEHENWRVPFDAGFLTYHIGVFGATGSGKSWLTRHVLVPVLAEAGFRVLILDWSGGDYAPFYRDRTVPISKLKLDEEAVVDYIMEKAKQFGYKSTWRDTNPIKEVLEDYVSRRWEETLQKSSEEIFVDMKAFLKNGIEQMANQKELRSDSYRGALRKLEYGFKKIKPIDLDAIRGSLSIEQLIEDLKREDRDIRIIDMSLVGSEEKLSLFNSLARFLEESMELGESLDIALVIDEGPQYAPWEPRGIQYESTEHIKNLCALGRKHRLCVVIISQGIAGDIGINAAVRRNLNTQFFGALHPLDMVEADNWLKPYGIQREYLLSLKPGQFYFVGKANPSPIPLLISFKPEG